MKNFISETSKIDNVNLGSNCKIYHFANLYRCKIGNNCKIGSYVEIQENTVIGNNVTISSHSFICSLVEIEDDVFISHGVMTVNDLYPPSFKKTGRHEWKKTIIKKGATIGTSVTLLPVTIGENSIIGAGSVVTKDVPRNTIYVGNPAKYLRDI